MVKIEELCPSFLSQAREISVKFEQAFKLFAACHFVYDSTEYLDDEKIDKLVGEIANWDINMYMTCIVLLGHSKLSFIHLFLMQTSKGSSSLSEKTSLTKQSHQSFIC